MKNIAQKIAYKIAHKLVSVNLIPAAIWFEDIATR